MSAQLLKKLGIKQVLLVTNALHMRRAVYAFKRNGVEVIPAPTGFIHKTNTRHVWLEGLPNGLAVKNVAYAMHEYVGLLWYYFK
nr:YdcF family protein [endosymbiont of Ridgeia piscesae]